jgi:glycosyltransferase involved in cell wall biosynthesis
LKILIHLRSDADAKHGGDVALARQYKRILEDGGHSVDITTSSLAFEGHYDLALTFNLDRPFEPAQFIDNCNKNNIPVMIYALHHPTAGVAQYLKFGTKGLRRVFAMLAGCRPALYESILALVKVASGQMKIQRAANLKFLYASIAQRFILNNVNTILVSTQMELSKTAEEFQVAQDRFAVVPHILDIAPVSSPLPTGPERQIDVICAGRFESRKNQLLVARLARKMTTTKFVFVGTPSSTEARYFAEFQAEIAGLDNVAYYPSLPLDELRAMFRNARLFISLSWFEVVSLTEMEAMACGCHLLVGKNSYAEYFTGDRAIFVEPDALESVGQAMQAWLDQDRKAAPAFAGLTADDRIFEMAPAQVARAFSSIFDKLKVRS